MSGPNGWQRFIFEASRSKEGWEAFQAYRNRSGWNGRRSKSTKLEELLTRHVADRVLIFTAETQPSTRSPAVSSCRQSLIKPRAGKAKQVLERFHSGAYPVVVTSQVLNEGVDVPSANVGIVLSGSSTIREKNVQSAGVDYRGSSKTSRRFSTRLWHAAPPKSSPASGGGSITPFNDPGVTSKC